MEGIPEQAWVIVSGAVGALIAAFIALIVALIQNKAANKRLQTQLASENSARVDERKNVFKKEIYYGAIESIAVSIKYLNNLCEADLKESNQYLTSDLTANFFKVQLIAGDDVLKSFFEYNNLVVQSMLTLMPHKLDLQKLEIEHESAKELRHMALEAHKGVTLKMDKLNEEKQYAPALWEPLKHQSEVYSSDMEKYNNKASELSKEITIKKIQFLKKNVNIINRVNISASAVISSMRQELSLDENEETSKLLEELIKQSNLSNEKHMNDFIDKINETINHV